MSGHELQSIDFPIVYVKLNTWVLEKYNPALTINSNN